MEATPVAHNAGEYRGFALAQLRILSDYCRRYNLNIASRKVVLNNGVVVMCNVCYNKEDVLVTLPTAEVKTLEVVTEETINVLIHPRQGAVKLFSYYTWESGVAGIVQVPHKLIHGVAGGWTNGKTTLVGEYIYPLIDEDNASYELTSTSADDEELTGSFAGSAGNYGNLYWHNEDDEEPIFLSWKGTPARHFRLANNIEINGFSVQETATPGVDEDMPIFTAFGNKIYQDGAILYTAPRWNWPYSGQDRCFILGAMQDGNGDVWAMMQSDRWNVMKYIVYFSDGHRIASDNEGDKSSYLSSHSGVTVSFEKEYPVKKGIFTMLWKQGGPVDGWTFVAEWNTGRQGLPWFGNKAGTEFVSPGGDRITVGGNWFDASTGSGTYAETKTGDAGESIFQHGRFDANFSAHDFYEFALDAIVSGSRSLSFSATTDKTYVEPALKAYTGSFRRIYNPDDPDQAPRPLRFLSSIADTYLVVVGQPFFAGTADGQGTRTFTYTGFTVNDQGIVTSVSYCGNGSAVGSVTVTDECGDVITKEVRLNGGMWVLASESIATCSDSQCSSSPCNYGQSIACGYYWIGWYYIDLTNPANKALYDAQYSQPDIHTPGTSYTESSWRWVSRPGVTSSLGNTVIGNQEWVLVNSRTFNWVCP